ncbi:MAG: TetR/AcrR family transcriptional regulator [Acidimicrobiia bacterium]
MRASARRLVEAQGFAATTIAAIAADAGVSEQTIYAAFGGKAGLVGAMLEDIEQAADASGTEASLATARSAAEQLDVFLEWICRLFEHGRPIFLAAADAAHDPDVGAMVEAGNTRRREGTDLLTRAWAEQGALRRDLSPRAASETLWILTSFQQYRFATDALGWSTDTYRAWLAGVLHLYLFAP